MATTTRAPIDKEALEHARAEFGYSRTLPAHAYRSDEIFAWEQEHFFAKGWVCVGRGEDLPAAGHQRAVRVGADGLLLVRDESDRLRAFFNVCRHRGHELLEPNTSAQGRAIRCPYHTWAYELDGSLKAAPRFGEQPGFNPAEHALVPCRVAEWHGWLFANLSGDAPELGDYLGDVEELVRHHQPEKLVAAARQEYVAAANWKLLVENYHECYHCPSIHPQLCRVTPPESGRNIRSRGAWVGGSMDLMPHAQTMSFTGESKGVFLTGLDARQRRQVYYYGLFPNLLVSPHPDYVLTHRLEPLAPDRTRIECQWFFPSEALEKEGFDPAYAVDFWDITNRQDWRACESVQRGVSSRGYRPGPLARREDAVYEFISMVARGYLGEPVHLNG